MAAKCLIPALTYLCFVQGQSPCTTPDGKSGDCKSILACDHVRGMADKPRLTTAERDYLKKSLCGFDDTIQKVCCPKAPTSSCFTPENNAGQCVDIYDCNHVKTRLTSPTVTEQYKIYVNSLRCPGPAPFSVCCGPAPAPTPVATPTPVDEPIGDCASAALPDPAGDCCGQDSASNKILGGNATGIDQYPWLALIEYQSAGEISLLCGGVLISSRYVLTAGHCVMGRVLNTGQPTNVRLGEYDTENSVNERDCVEAVGAAPGQLDCADEPVIIPIERIIAHPEYIPQSRLRRNDIAILRLVSIAPYTDFIRPICLPTADVTKNFPATGTLFSAGWGNTSGTTSYLKLHVPLPYKTIEVCQKAYSVPSRRVTLWDRHVCAGGELGKDSCRGDSGGPLMYSEADHYELIGIISFGPIRCGLEDVPGVHTKVFEYLTWIRSNIQP